ncbi:MAG: hypothetical protein HY594_03590 [Candidatus Omnitrophica bacterium]|nr:hypothetical protein [Candidatus Omnitrophota bacterium]
MNRLLGIKMYGTYALVIGSINCIGNLALAVFVLKTTGNRPISPAVLLFWSAIGAVLFAAGIGVFQMKRWGRWLALATSSLSLTMAAVNLLKIPAAGAAQTAGFIAGYILFPIVLNGSVLWYFLKPEVQGCFE